MIFKKLNNIYENWGDLKRNPSNFLFFKNILYIFAL